MKNAIILAFCLLVGQSAGHAGSLEDQLSENARYREEKLHPTPTPLPTPTPAGVGAGEGLVVSVEADLSRNCLGALIVGEVEFFGMSQSGGKWSAGFFDMPSRQRILVLDYPDGEDWLTKHPKQFTISEKDEFRFVGRVPVGEGRPRETIFVNNQGLAAARKLIAARFGGNAQMKATPAPTLPPAQMATAEGVGAGEGLILAADSDLPKDILGAIIVGEVEFFGSFQSGGNTLAGFFDLPKRQRMFALKYPGGEDWLTKHPKQFTITKEDGFRVVGRVPVGEGRPRETIFIDNRGLDVARGIVAGMVREAKAQQLKAAPAPVLVPVRQVVPDPTTGMQESIAIAKTTSSAEAEKQFKQADAELNAVYKEVKRSLRPSDQNELMKAQRTWVASKEDALKTIGSEEARFLFLTRVTKDRTEQLRRMMKTVSEAKPVPLAQKASHPKLVRADAAALTPGDVLEGPWKSVDSNGSVTVLAPPYFAKMRIFAAAGYVSGPFNAVRYTGRNGLYFMCVPVN